MLSTKIATKEKRKNDNGSTVSTKKVRFKKKKEGNGKRKFVLNKISSNLFESRNDINYYMWLKVKLIFFSTEKLFFYRFLGRDRVFFFFLFSFINSHFFWQKVKLLGVKRRLWLHSPVHPCLSVCFSGGYLWK